MYVTFGRTVVLCTVLCFCSKSFCSFKWCISKIPSTYKNATPAPRPFSAKHLRQKISRIVLHTQSWKNKIEPLLKRCCWTLGITFVWRVSMLPKDVAFAGGTEKIFDLSEAKVCEFISPNFWGLFGVLDLVTSFDPRKWLIEPIRSTSNESHWPESMAL